MKYEDKLRDIVYRSCDDPAWLDFKQEGHVYYGIAKLRGMYCSDRYIIAYFNENSSECNTWVFDRNNVHVGTITEENAFECLETVIFFILDIVDRGELLRILDNGEYSQFDIDLALTRMNEYRSRPGFQSVYQYILSVINNTNTQLPPVDLEDL